LCFSGIFSLSIFATNMIGIYLIIKGNSSQENALYIDASLLVIVVNYTSYSVFITGPIFRFILSYVYINYSLAFSFKLCISQVISNSNSLSIYKIRYIKHLVASHRELREEINTTMGIIPTVNISFAFLHTIIHFTSITTKKMNLASNLLHWINYSFVLTINMFMVIVLGLIPTDNQTYLKIIAWLTEADNKSYDFVSHHASLNLERIITINYLHLLINNPIQHNACDIFLIDKRFLLIFISSLIPFCVMFIQMYQTN